MEDAWFGIKNDICSVELGLKEMNELILLTVWDFTLNVSD